VHQREHILCPFTAVPNPNQKSHIIHYIPHLGTESPTIVLAPIPKWKEYGLLIRLKSTCTLTLPIPPTISHYEIQSMRFMVRTLW
jgi:hypothetical protein